MNRINRGFDRLFVKFKRKFLNSRLVLLLDLCLSVLCSLLVFLVTLLFTGRGVLGQPFALAWMISSFAASLLMFWICRTYAIIIRHTTFKDVITFMHAALGKALIMLAVMLLLGHRHQHVPTMLAVDFLLTVLVLLGVRLVMIYAYDVYKSKVRAIQRHGRVLVYGTSEKALAALDRLAGSKRYDPVGIITPDTSIRSKTIKDYAVYTYSSDEDFRKIVHDMSLAGVIFATDSDAQKEQFGLVRLCNAHDVKILIVPSIDEIGQNQFFVREVKIEDLLGREEISISLDEIKKMTRGKTVLVTGAAGSIGSELCRQLATLEIGKLILYDNSETPMHSLRLEIEERWPELDFVPVIGDVRACPRLDFAFRKHRPQIVFHAAAYKHVPLMEENPCEAVLANVIGTRQVADKCIEYGAEKMVMISTDKAVNPTNVMGCSKRIAEIYVQSLGLAVERGEIQGKTNFVTTRFGNVLGSNGSVIPRFREQIAKGGPVTVTHPDITRFFMTIPEACRLVMEAAAMPISNRICVFDMGEPVKIDTLARRMIQLSGFTPDEDIKIVYSGLRPGEKLYEEVLSNVENTEPSSHSRIRIAHVREYTYSDALKAVEDLEVLSRKVEIEEMVRYMKELVPEYISNNSKYSIYDKKQ